MKKVLLSILRDKKTDANEFRYAADRLGELLAAEAAESVPIKSKFVVTPLAKSSGFKLGSPVLIAVILRSGFVFLPPFLKLFPKAAVGFVGMKRDEQTAVPQLYYENLPKTRKKETVFLLDPMIATGGSALLAIERLIQNGTIENQINLVSAIASKKGLETIQRKHPKIKINCVMVDPILDQSNFIVPGLGDFGDRYFGSES